MEAEDAERARKWATAERLAVMAEEALRGATQAHLERGAARPPDEMEQNARELRRAADPLEIYGALKAQRAP